MFNLRYFSTNKKKVFQKKNTKNIQKLVIPLKKTSFIKKKENFNKKFLPKKKNSYPLSFKLVKIFFKKKFSFKEKKLTKIKTKFKKNFKFSGSRVKKFSLKKKFFMKIKKRRRFKFKSNFRYVRLLKKFVFFPKKLRTRFLYKLILTTKQAFLQYYRKFSLKNFTKIHKLYKKNQLKLTKFEKFIMFFELRVNCVLVRIRYAKYTLYSNMLILTGQIRINGQVIIFCDYQVKLFDILEISYIAFYRQYFKRYLFRKYYKYHVRIYGEVYRYRSRYIYFLLKSKLRKLPRWLFYTVLRVFKVAPTYALLLHIPTNDYFVQSKRVLATIFYRLPYKFKDRKLSRFMTKKHMKFFSNFCTLFT
jgi:ribosomal protein S4